MMSDKNEILKKRFYKLQKHYEAFKSYAPLIEEMLLKEDILTVEKFNFIVPKDRAIFDAYIKRFASIQDFLGAKIFPSLVEISGIGSVKMTEVLYHMEREGVIDSIDNWIELREIRNDLEHDYPEELEEALKDLKYCIESFTLVESYVQNARKFAGRFNHAIV
jgi:hypothetical protein